MSKVMLEVRELTTKYITRFREMFTPLTTFP
jgi:hypothetical protein